MAFFEVIEELKETIGIAAKGGKGSYLLKIIGVALLSVLLGVGGFFGYRWYIISREQSAQKLLGDYIQEYQKASRAKSKQEWSEVASLFGLGYDQHKRSKTGAYFLAFKADALEKEGNRIQALEALNQLISTLDVKNPLQFLFKLKRALISIDIQDDQIKDGGLIELSSLAQEPNLNQEVAQFYLGNYFWNQNNLDQARVVWEQLVTNAQDEKQPASPWVERAKERLAQIP